MIRIDEIKEQINVSEEIKERLRALREDVKEAGMIRDGLREQMEELLFHTDPKVRRLAAQTLGAGGSQKSLLKLFEAYEKETTLYVRADYLEAIKKLDYTRVLPGLKIRFNEIRYQETEKNEQIHLAKECKCIFEMLAKAEGIKRHGFVGLYKEQEILLTTKRNLQEVTIAQLKHLPKKKVSMGVMVKSSNAEELYDIRTFDEMLFYFGETSARELSFEELARELLRLRVVEFLEKCHKAKHPFGVRMQVEMPQEADKRGQFAKRLGLALYGESRGFLVNATTGYEAEIRLLQMNRGAFRVFVKLFTIPKRRFHYRKETIATSIRPYFAATLCYMAKPYMMEGAQILDPFCGVGTMLIERRMLVRGGDTYGVDCFGDAIIKARMNSAEVGPNIHYIHRNVKDFRHDYLFDEFITDMPVRTRAVNRIEIKECYEILFSKAKELLKIKGIMIVYGNEHGFMRQMLRRNPEFSLVREYVIEEEKGTYLYIIRREGK